MGTLAEIEAALVNLSPAELEELEGRLRELNSARRAEGKVFTGNDAASWWQKRTHMAVAEAELFARDVESGRSELAPPPELKWE